ncbi:MAG: transposase [Acidithiobacillus sp.]
MLHRFRQAMIRQNRDRLNGFVEVDETYLSITDRSITTDRKRKSDTNKLLVVIAIEIHQPKGFGRVRLKYITDGNKECLLPFVKEVIKKGSHIQTDGPAAYRNLKINGYDHEDIVVFNSAIPAHTFIARSTPGCFTIATPDSWNTSGSHKTRAS